MTEDDLMFLGRVYEAYLLSGETAAVDVPGASETIPQEYRLVLDWLVKTAPEDAVRLQALLDRIEAGATS